MKIGIIGAGAWGAALALVASQKAQSVALFGRDQTLIAAINAKQPHKNLAGFLKPHNVIATTAIDDLLNADILLSCLPTQTIRGFLSENGTKLPAVPFILCSKGIEQSTGLYGSDIVAELAPHLTPALLSGPSFADDVVKGLPTAVTIANAHEGTAKILSQSLSTPTFRLYHTTDMRGVEIGGACKNVLAIAAGIVAGQGLGASALAALISRGFAEMTRFGVKNGADPITLTGLSGLGDLILSCNSPQSRNFSYGFALGRGEPLPLKLAEGAFTASILHELAVKQGIDMPLVSQINSVLKREISVKDAISALMNRPLRGER